VKKISILIVSKMCNLGNKNVRFCVIKVIMLKDWWRQVIKPIITPAALHLYLTVSRYLRLFLTETAAAKQDEN
jgi:hypothetical protein